MNSFPFAPFSFRAAEFPVSRAPWRNKEAKRSRLIAVIIGLEDRSSAWAHIPDKLLLMADEVIG
jgi:hypothetical protein